MWRIECRALNAAHRMPRIECCALNLAVGLWYLKNQCNHTLLMVWRDLFNRAPYGRNGAIKQITPHL
jgi:hypothetical protein